VIATVVTRQFIFFFLQNWVSIGPTNVSPIFDCTVVKKKFFVCDKNAHWSIFNTTTAAFLYGILQMVASGSVMKV